MDVREPLFEAAESRDVIQSAPIDLRKGQKFSVGAKYEGDKEWDGWYCCIAKGVTGWVPESVICMDGDEGMANEDYSSFELSIEKGEMLRGLKETGGWVWCENSKGICGWVPKEYLKVSKNDW